MSFTDIANTSGTYTINKADAVITVDDAAFNYVPQSHSIPVEILTLLVLSQGSIGLYTNS